MKFVPLATAGSLWLLMLEAPLVALPVCLSKVVVESLSLGLEDTDALLGDGVHSESFRPRTQRGSDSEETSSPSIWQTAWQSL